MANLEEIKTKILEGGELESILQKFDWREFENFTAEIFQNNGFTIKQNFRFKTSKRYEIDLIAISGRHVLCVDCKEWGRGRYKNTGLRYAAGKQEKRLEEFKKFLKKNPIATKMLKIKPKTEFHPVIVTLFEEELKLENKTMIVPAWKLNGFLLEMENYLY